MGDPEITLSAGNLISCLDSIMWRRLLDECHLDQILPYKEYLKLHDKFESTNVEEFNESSASDFLSSVVSNEKEATRRKLLSFITQSNGPDSDLRKALKDGTFIARNAYSDPKIPIINRYVMHVLHDLFTIVAVMGGKDRWTLLDTTETLERAMANAGEWFSPIEGLQCKAYKNGNLHILLDRSVGEALLKSIES